MTHPSANSASKPEERRALLALSRKLALIAREGTKPHFAEKIPLLPKNDSETVS